MSVANPDVIRRRKVFYLPGYDPFHPRRYRELYRTESRKQAEISGYEIALAPKQAGGAFGWTVHATIEGAAVETEMEVLVWSDLVRKSMSNSIIGTYWQLIRTAWIYLGSGALFRLMTLRKGPMIAALYPVAVLLGQLVLAILAGSFAARLMPHPLLGLAVGLGMGWGVLHLFKRWDPKLFAYYLMHDYAHTAQHKGAYPKDLAASLVTFRARIAAAQEAGYDEILVVGHSSGAHLAVSILAELPERAGSRVALLTLGHVVPMVSFLPQAKGLRRDLQRLSERCDIAWVDVTAPGDGCAFALCDPVAVSGVARAAQRWPLVFSAAFTQSLAPETWAALRWRFFRLHFQYMCAFDRPKDYDYFQITAGPRALSERYAGRKASKSRITRAASGYRSVE